MSSRFIRTGLACALAAGLLGAIAGCSGSSASSSSAPPQGAPAAQVSVVTVQPQNQPVTTELSGRTRARLSAEIRPQVGGIVQQRLFEEGALVKAGQVLYQLDPATYKAAYASAQASVAKAESTVNAAKVTARRNAELAKIEAVSQQTSEDSQATLQQAEADLGVARAALDTARINLGFTRITAPIAGRIEASTVTPGALVTASQTTALTTVQQLDPIHVDVTQSTTELLRLQRELAAGTLKSGGERGQRGERGEASVKLLLEDGTAYAHAGRLQFSSVTVSESTGAVTLRILVPNPERTLLPGMYVRAVLEEGVAEQALLVPQQGVTRTASGDASALVVTADNKVEKRALRVSRAVGNRWQVTEGLKAGERVIVEGSLRVKPGDTVKPVAADATTVAAAAAAPAAH
ncbi:efflux RND transporter periplasmic adaptor subunit [Variovorax guangxiensis]|uniref:Efflux RND transporter periplasmic adaptor subunit n=1 Tax=Variovorax guangxiensis TaxID=1775474 RepID=A0A433MTZ8_9BURK|nr:efflux RND transporter periplasmic adaptor subunit [Variovorax guangxiensis]RUR71300.1 efflux RND transporter periplasmic adaptor subunit [Variovorax guangxiensis]